uniref:26S proteasome non-ATPase regulatory subunit RPN1 C-terminal domain-containing protein n=1 Tax=Timema tahoe TaxID=61484 RepID=A0A7R9IQ97_9NEOP|nr:unnamed protein product [Timema tahoe]
MACLTPRWSLHGRQTGFPGLERQPLRLVSMNQRLSSWSPETGRVTPSLQCSVVTHEGLIPPHCNQTSASGNWGMCPPPSPPPLKILAGYGLGYVINSNVAILGKSHYLLFTLAAAMQPRMLVTFDEELNPLPVPVRVGLALDVVGQAGKPKTITGFQTHTTPVLLAFGERAELATEEYIPLTPIMEGFNNLQDWKTTSRPKSKRRLETSRRAPTSRCSERTGQIGAD